MIPVLQWAASSSDSWKPKYYLALLLWNAGRGDEAGAIFERCGDAPDFAPFYLARAKFMEMKTVLPEGDKGTAGEKDVRILGDLKRALALDPADWKIQHALISRLITTGGFAEALDAAQKACHEGGPYFILEMDYAKALLISGKYESALDVLKSTRILPYEGAWEGRDLYRQANLYLASSEIARKNYAKSLRFAEAARAWPEHLGVGRPFDTDERLENYLAAVSYERAGDRSQARKYYEAVVADSRKFKDSWGASRYVSASAMTSLGMNGQAEELISAWKKKFPESSAAAWASAKMSGDEKKAGEILAELEVSTPGFPWNLAAFDREFPVVLEILRLMR
jgi:tetratricopeptide (TPR) repeat protein